MALTYHILDVFTERPFGGNPLAVVLEADRLTPADMQMVAREFNLSETVFVLKPTSPGHTARIRIFTPSREIPFAGHPTLGTAILLADLRTQIVNGESDAIIALEEEIGSVRVGVRLRAGHAAYGEFDAPKTTITPEELPQPEEISAAIGLIPTEVGFENHKPMLLKGSSIWAYVPVANLEAMSKLRVAPSHWARAFTDRGTDGVYVYSRQCVRGNASFHARMFAPDLGIPEDPATGSAAGSAAAWLVAHKVVKSGERVMIEQGREMNRPGELFVSAEELGEQITNVRVGGHAVQVATGELIF